MAQTLFYLICRKPIGEPLIPDFLSGDYDRGQEFKVISEVEDGELVGFSKNISRMPKILGRAWLVLPTDLMLDLRGTITAKWRQVQFTSPFDYPWSNSGFEIFEQYIQEQELRSEQAGISEDDMEFHVNFDPSLAYLDFVDRYRIADYQPTTNYWELIVNSATRVAKIESREDAVGFVQPRKGKPYFELRDDSSDKLFSYSSLLEYQVLSVGSGWYALTPSQFEKFKPYLEPEYFFVEAIDATDLPNII